jgi:hypothetical protein
MLPTKRLELPSEMRIPVPGVGLDQAARKPADAVASQNFAQFGSERMSGEDRPPQERRSSA